VYALSCVDHVANNGLEPMALSSSVPAKGKEAEGGSESDSFVGEMCPRIHCLLAEVCLEMNDVKAALDHISLSAAKVCERAV
jgi:hypothetical protein